MSITCFVSELCRDKKRIFSVQSWTIIIYTFQPLDSSQTAVQLFFIMYLCVTKDERCQAKMATKLVMAQTGYDFVLYRFPQKYISAVGTIFSMV